MPEKPGTQVISRVCRILRSFDRSNPELSLTELARKNRLHPTTAFRILQALVEEDFLIQDAESTKYCLGYGVVKLGELAKQGNAFLKIAQPYAEKLAQIWGELITLEVLNRDLRLDTVLFIPSTYRIGALPPRGKSLPPHCTATGKAQLAYLPADRLNIALNRELEALTVNTITDPVSLRADLMKVRERGYAIAQEELEIGFMAVAAPIFDINGQVLAGISVGGPSSRLTKDRIEEIAKSVVEIAKAISEEVGYEENNKSP